MEKKLELNVAMIGYGFMGRAHSNAFLCVNRFFDLPLKFNMKIICGRTEDNVKHMQKKWGWEEYSLDWKEVVKRDDIDVIDVGTPNNLHVPIILEAAKMGKHILCEKPLGITVQECKKAVEAVKKAKIYHMIWHNFQKAPALSLAKSLISEGRIGKIFHVRAVFLSDRIVDPKYPLKWRLKKEVSGSGAHGDICVHIIDAARFLVGEIKEVTGMMETFIKERPLPENPKQKGKVTVDDMSAFLCRFENGAVGIFEATRFALGRKAHNKIEVNGSKGSLVWCSEDMNILEFYSEDDPKHIRGFRKILATENIHPYIKGYWPPGHIIGYEHTFINGLVDFACAFAMGKMPKPNLEDGLRNQMILEAVIKSAETKKWIQVD
ncbi:MAG: Gfo/Idh/MocA family oxidoreductase [Desulfobacteraceae bacterium]|nr:Gfo/Idh/MocA family oxidoreductase [Desulfobacteraceae bacterium]